jgi:hypothetical protein
MLLSGSFVLACPFGPDQLRKILHFSEELGGANFGKINEMNKRYQIIDCFSLHPMHTLLSMQFRRASRARAYGNRDLIKRI